MNIQRKYSLPNCTLLLEGLSDATRAVHFQEMRPELSILVNAECYLSGYNQPLVGGREFFESLVRAVSGYAQEFLSSVPNPLAHNTESELVQFEKIHSNRHRLIVHSDVQKNAEAKYNNGKTPIQIDLNSVQLFDLVEAVDQFFADSQTLPELSLELQPVGKGSGIASQAFIKQAVPAGVGVSSLAVCALAFGLIPAPQVRQPQQQTNSTTPSPTASATDATNAIASPTPLANATPTPTTTPTATSVVTTDLETLLKTVPEITDASQLRALQRQVYNQINPDWANRSGLNEDLVYRIGVAADGAMVGYKATNKQANQAIEKTPLPKLLYNPAKRGGINNEPIAQFRVVFTQQGVLQVSPWRGYANTPQVIGAKITDGNAVKDLNKKLYDTIRQNWSGTPSFSQDLKYRVAVNKDGTIADYEPLNQVAFDYFRETPLPKIFNTLYGSNVAPPNIKQPLAHYQVVFQPNGTLEVTPWQGYQ
ncbi:DUF4335 domain-containing protein [Scytonema hofmannii FACHB-248]|uniref:DUF4335 domain-containing protein n=1 Tax=Scytonema hofmannii FACHB-248 TaxID=1842502 RepID=A0ABR8GV88_9CYAN|nr:MULTISPECIES: DUF4335 domain-containing protein [Nostocales]MBD2607169.1 DUF4335 domain-containing protein [Scytonema hofmannii FACHB-248]